MRILYVTTTFPVYSETFLQREVRAMKQAGEKLSILSLHKGDDRFDELEIRRFSKWRLLLIPFLLFRLAWRRSESLKTLFSESTRHKPRSWLNFWENLLGFGAAIVMEKEVQSMRPDLIHCVWASAPAAFGRLASLLCGTPYSMGAHAYDVFEFGGDWLLSEKARNALLIHTTTHSALGRLKKDVSEDKIRLIYRGMNVFPAFKKLRSDRRQLRIICIGRLVEKKGFPLQIEIYRSLFEAEVPFEARIVGGGPMEDWILQELKRVGLSQRVSLLGRLSQEETAEQLQWADVLFHTGIVAKSGDRDGLPNVIPEAMSSGVLVVASAVSGVVEAISDENTGFLRDPSEPRNWVDVCQRIQVDDALCERIRDSARSWVEGNFEASINSATLLSEMRKALDSQNSVKLLESSAI